MLEIFVLPATRGVSRTAHEGAKGAMLHLAGEVEVVYSQADAEALMDILFFIEAWAKEWGLKTSALPKVLYKNKPVTPTRYGDTVAMFIESDDTKDERVKVRFTYRDSTRTILSQYLLHLERKVTEERTNTDEGFTVDLAHPLFYPAQNSELNRELVRVETLRDFFKALVTKHFPDWKRMN